MSKFSKYCPKLRPQWPVASEAMHLFSVHLPSVTRLQWEPDPPWISHSEGLKPESPREDKPRGLN